MNQAHYEHVRSTALSERVIEAFTPDRGGIIFQEFGGVSRAACYKGMGRLVLAVRMDQDMPLPCHGRAMLLRTGGMVSWDKEHNVYEALQPEFFESSFKRILSDGTEIIGLDQSTDAQVKAIVDVNRNFQMQFQKLVGFSVRKALMFRKVKRERRRLFELSSGLVLHMADLKHQARLRHAAKSAIAPTSVMRDSADQKVSQATEPLSIDSDVNMEHSLQAA